ncbi:MAG: protoheme IX farnesyltransferase [Fimbriimonas ginsengisoli]|uniref:Protoheme IX farnesyltransferase n=1 Tax=Fimbriimonas ginsengisoli TaxID=1005039 RepID=A0A931PWM1_FIMGI|nr:protoheme IX farnesyltransferase [Fimbriimonas ginsengisoli]
MTRTRFPGFVWGILIYNFLTVAWGAFVRASFSGDGCGINWPLCDGQFIPTNASAARWIEFSHRASAGFVLVLVAAMAVWAFRAFPKGHQARPWSIASLGFTCSEALIGAWLVKYKLVAHNESAYRAVAMTTHLINTFLLLAALTITLASATRDKPFRLRGQGAVPWAVGFGLLLVILLGITGALSALGHMLRPVDNVLASAIIPGAHYLNRLQPLHPLIATSVGLYIVLLGGLLIHLRPSEEVRNRVQWTVILYALQFSFGLLNIALSAPVWMQLVHLVLADALWVSLILTAVSALREGVPSLDTVEREQIESAPRPRGKELVSHYVKLTKPRVISLLLFTTLAAMFAAQPGWPGGWLLLAVAVAGYMSAGAANAINMVIDRDIDATMKRTAKRPTVTLEISPANALVFGFALAIGSFILFWAAANLLAAMLSLAGLVFYVIVYTLVLKRRTWQNIVIGGAAGCFPPLVGWAAVRNELSPLALVLFAIVFVWTPVHFWALALLIKDDYAKAGIPMLPVVKGVRTTVIQITLYAAFTMIVSVLPLVQGEASWLYMGSIVLLNAFLLARCIGLIRTTDRPHAVSLYKFSMLYLALLFLMVAADRAMIWHPIARTDRGSISELPRGMTGPLASPEGQARMARADGSTL